MNERIKELWWKARIGYNEQNCDPEVLEKFAELIVGECMDLASTEQRRYANIYHRDMHESAIAVSNFRLLMKEHFGVEE